MKYRFTSIIEGDVIREISEDEKAKLKQVTEQSLAKGLYIVEYKIEKIEGHVNAQIKTVEPTTSMSDMFSKLKTK